VVVLLGVSHFKDDYYVWIEALLALEAKIRTGVEGQAISAPHQPVFGMQAVDSAVVVGSATALDFPTGGGPEFQCSVYSGAWTSA
jgi:hypothetical protein